MTDHPRSARDTASLLPQQTTLDWARDRLANTYRLAATKNGDDRDGWLQDAAYWEDIVKRLAQGEAARDPGPQQPRAFWLSNMAEQMQESRSPDGDGLGKTGTDGSGRVEMSARDTAPLLQQAKRDVIAGIDAAITTLKGSVEFRDAVEELLKGTPHEKPASHDADFEGLYGRLRNALRAQGEAARDPGPQLGQEWVTRVTSQDGEEPSVMGAGDPGLRVPLEQLRDYLRHKRECQKLGPIWEWPRHVHDELICSCGLDALLARATPPPQNDGVALIAQERQRQINAEGWTTLHDDAHNKAELVAAASCYAVLARRQIDRTVLLRADTIAAPQGWPWEPSWWKPSDDPIRNLVKAGALIAAELDRLQRATPRVPAPEEP